MWRNVFRISVGVIVLITIAIGFSIFSIHAQGDYKTPSRTQEDQWCKDHGFDGVTARDEHPQTVYSFPFCQKNGTLYQVDMIQLCRDLFGDAYANPQYWDYYNYDSWYCNHVNAPAPTAVPPQQNNGGNGGSSGNGNTGGSSGGNTNPNPPQQGSTGNTDCPAVPSRLSSGQSAWVSDYDPEPLKVFVSPSMDAQQLPGVPIRETVIMGQGPSCIGGRIWWTITYQGVTGWVVEVNHNNTYNLIPGTWGGAGGNKIIAQAVSLDNVATFVFRLNVQNCEIVNGSDFVTSEIRRLNRGSVSGKAQIGWYLAEVIGTSEDIRKRMEQTLMQAAPSCTSFRYQVGTRTMDTSGPGNIIFGYYAAFYGFPLEKEDELSDWAQGLNPASLGQFWDNDDDPLQRRVGRALHSMAPNPGDVTSETLASIADQMRLF